jgi:hypothetical protein
VISATTAISLDLPSLEAIDDGVLTDDAIDALAALLVSLDEADDGKVEGETNV